MPLYFFEWTVEGAVAADDRSQELDSRPAVRRLVNDAVYHRLREHERTQNSRFECTVRDESGAHIYHQALVVPAFTEQMMKAQEERNTRRAAAREARLAAQGQKAKNREQAS